MVFTFYISIPSLFSKNMNCDIITFCIKNCFLNFQLILLLLLFFPLKNNIYTHLNILFKKNIGKNTVQTISLSFLSKYPLFHVLPVRCFTTSGQNGGHIRNRSKKPV